MTLQEVFWIIMAIGVLLIVPAALVWTMVDYFRGRGSDRQGSGGISSGISAAMQELDRLVARPSVEHTIETEHPVLKREDDSGND
jgi:hypothetical protein